MRPPRLKHSSSVPPHIKSRCEYGMTQMSLVPAAGDWPCATTPVQKANMPTPARQIAPRIIILKAWGMILKPAILVEDFDRIGSGLKLRARRVFNSFNPLRLLQHLQRQRLRNHHDSIYVPKNEIARIDHDRFCQFA